MDGLYVDPHASDATNHGWLAVRATKILLHVALTSETMPAPALVLTKLCYTCSTNVLTESVHVIDLEWRAAFPCNCSIMPTTNCENPMNSHTRADSRPNDEENEDGDDE